MVCLEWEVLAVAYGLIALLVAVATLDEEPDALDLVVSGVVGLCWLVMLLISLVEVVRAAQARLSGLVRRWQRRD